MDARDLVVTGDVECGARHIDPNIHQDIVQALSGRNIVFRNFTSGNPGRPLDVLGCRRWLARHARQRRHSQEPDLQPLPAGDLQPEPAHRQVDPFRSQAIRLRLQLVRHLHRPGSPTAREQAERVIEY